MLTIQEIFDKSIGGLLEQGRPSRTDDGCVYAGPHGTACAVGILLPREVAQEWDSEGTFGINTIMNSAASRCKKKLQQLVEAGIPVDWNTLIFLSDLQRVHDSYNLDDFELSIKYGARELAARYKLDPRVAL